jgi:hypothetical protein
MTITVYMFDSLLVQVALVLLAATALIKIILWVVSRI